MRPSKNPKPLGYGIDTWEMEAEVGIGRLRPAFGVFSLFLLSNLPVSAPIGTNRFESIWYSFWYSCSTCNVLENVVGNEIGCSSIVPVRPAAFHKQHTPIRAAQRQIATARVAKRPNIAVRRKTPISWASSDRGYRQSKQFSRVISIT